MELNKNTVELTYTWETEECHADNSETMADFLEFHLPEDIEIVWVDGTYAEIKLPDGTEFEVHASGNGDSYSHKVDIYQY